jgi:hypothetical protein
MPLQKPNLRLVGGAVVPNDFFFVGSNDAPWRPNEDGITVLVDDRGPASHLMPLQKPNLRLVGGTVVPNDFPVVDSNNFPWRPNEDGITVLVDHRGPASHLDR